MKLLTLNGETLNSKNGLVSVEDITRSFDNVDSSFMKAEENSKEEREKMV